MKLKDYIKEVLETIPDDIDAGITFDIGLNNDMEVDNASPNRVKFSCRRKK